MSELHSQQYLKVTTQGEKMRSKRSEIYIRLYNIQDYCKTEEQS